MAVTLRDRGQPVVESGYYRYMQALGIFRLRQPRGFGYRMDAVQQCQLDLLPASLQALVER
jgi:hypothetical protein